MRAHAERAPIAEEPRPFGLGMCKTRLPDQRAVAENPKIAHIAKPCPRPAATVRRRDGSSGKPAKRTDKGAKKKRFAEAMQETSRPEWAQRSPNALARRFRRVAVWRLFGRLVLAGGQDRRPSQPAACRPAKARRECRMRQPERRRLSVPDRPLLRRRGVGAAARAVSVTAGAFRSAGQIYDPMWVSAELESPAKITSPGTAISVNWESLRRRAAVAAASQERNLRGRGLRRRPDGGTRSCREAFEGEMRPNGADLDVTARFWRSPPTRRVFEGRRVPPLSGEADIRR